MDWRCAIFGLQHLGCVIHVGIAVVGLVVEYIEGGPEAILPGSRGRVDGVRVGVESLPHESGQHMEQVEHGASFYPPQRVQQGLQVFCASAHAPIGDQFRNVAVGRNLQACQQGGPPRDGLHEAALLRLVVIFLKAGSTSANNRSDGP